MNPKVTKASGYQEGIFVVTGLIDGQITPSFFSSDIKSDIGKFIGDQKILLLFNELMMGNSFLVDYANVRDTKHDRKEEHFLTPLIGQGIWSQIISHKDLSARYFVVNNCLRTDHNCPTLILDFKDFGDYKKLKKRLMRHPKQHFNFENQKSDEGIILFK